MNYRSFYKDDQLNIFKVVNGSNILTIFIANSTNKKVDTVKVSIDGKEKDYTVNSNKDILSVEIDYKYSNFQPEVNLISAVVEGKKIIFKHGEPEFYVNAPHISSLGYEKNLYRKWMSSHCGMAKGNIQYIANKNDYYWNCTCGNHNLNCINRCTECGIDQNLLFSTEVPLDKYTNDTHVNIKVNRVVSLWMLFVLVVQLYVVMFLFNGDLLYSNSYLNSPFAIISRIVVPLAIFGLSLSIMICYMKYNLIACKILKVLRLILMLFMNVCFIFVFIRSSYSYLLTIGFDIIFIYAAIVYLKNKIFKVHKIVEISLISASLVAGFTQQIIYKKYDFEVDKEGIALTVYGNKSLTDYKIPSSIGGVEVYKVIFDGNFSNLESLYIPNSIQNIITAEASEFYSLDNVEIESDNNYIYDHDGIIMNYTSNKVYFVKKSATEITIDWNKVYANSFANMSHIETVNISSEVENISSYAFYNCESLKTINFAVDSNVNFLGERCFAECPLLTKVELPDSLVEVEQMIFNNDVSLKELKVPFIGKKHYTTMSYEGDMDLMFFFDLGYDFRDLDYVHLDKVTITNQYIFGNSTFYGLDCKEINILNYEGALTQNMFRYCTFTSFTIPEKVTKISANCFADSSIQSITLNSNINEIDANAFNNTNLSSVTLNGFNKDTCSINEEGNSSFINLL